MSTRYPCEVEDTPRPSLNPKPRLGLPMDDPYGEDVERLHRTCPPNSRCTTCWPEAPQCPTCGQSVSCPGSFCSRCEEEADE